MKITYDRNANALYIQFKQEVIADTHEDEMGQLTIDYAADKSIIGIEVLNLSEKATLPFHINYQEI
ncbi:hypothetical protein GCM10027037_26290 [Mucilaginibacter koreensis]